MPQVNSTTIAIRHARYRFRLSNSKGAQRLGVIVARLKVNVTHTLFDAWLKRSHSLLRSLVACIGIF